MGPCAGVGRDPHGCRGINQYFSDARFHSEFRDGYNQPYHAWGYIAQSASPNNMVYGMFGAGLGLLGNLGHEVGQSVLRYPDHGWGTSWQDYGLSPKAMGVGLMISGGLISPGQLGDTVRSAFGPQGSGSFGLTPLLEMVYGPLADSPSLR